MTASNLPGIGQGTGTAAPFFLVRVVGRIACFFGRHDFPALEIHLNALYFCARGCGCEMFGRTLDDLRAMPPIDDERLAEIHREFSE